MLGTHSLGLSRLVLLIIIILIDNKLLMCIVAVTFNHMKRFSSVLFAYLHLASNFGTIYSQFYPKLHDFVALVFFYERVMMLIFLHMFKQHLYFQKILMVRHFENINF